jgi:hypothetical protein
MGPTQGPKQLKIGRFRLEPVLNKKRIEVHTYKWSKKKKARICAIYLDEGKKIAQHHIKENKNTYYTKAFFKNKFDA